jgi:uncharacterized membrane protein
MARLTLNGVLFGAAAMYLFDPDRGRRRRALLRDQFIKAASNVRDVFDAASRDFVNRGEGLVGETRSLLNRDAPIDDVLVERVRAKIGRYTQHPGAIEVGATEGEITLTGSILEDEHKRVLDAVRSVRGVKNIVDRLAVYQTPEGISELQGGKPRPGELPELLQDNWSPSTRIVTGATGATLALYSLRGGLPGLVLGVAGALVLLRSTANRPLRQLGGMAGQRGIDVQKTIEIDAPVDQVFEFLAKHENFPQFMRNVRRVEDRGNGRSHWVVAGPAGTEVEWDAATTRLEPNRLIAWRTMEGSTVDHAGFMRFEPVGPKTRVHICMSYSPPAGALGHAVAKLFSADAKTELDEDLMRLKTTVETGRVARDAAAHV